MSPSTAQGQRTRQELIYAAIDELTEQGYVAARVESIARRAGVSYGTFYRYFGSKLDFVAHVAEDVYKEIYAAVWRAPISDKPVADRVFSNILEFLRAYMANRKNLLVVEDAAGNDPQIASRVRELQLHHAARYAEKLNWSGYHPIEDRALIARICADSGYAVASNAARDGLTGDEDLQRLARVLTAMTMIAVDAEALQVPPDVVNYIACRLQA